MAHDLEKLLGGFAPDTLTPEERQMLYRAALEDQQLFDSLADEQALKELLADPSVRRRLLQHLTSVRSDKSGGSWLRWLRRPTGLAWAGGLAAAVFALVLGTQVYQDNLKRSSPTTTSEEAERPAPQQAQPLSPSSPSSAEREQTAKGTPEPAPPKAAKQRRAPSALSPEWSAADVKKDGFVTGDGQDKHRQEMDEPPAASRNKAEDASSGLPAVPSTPATPVPPQASAVAPSMSARARFYAPPTALMKGFPGEQSGEVASGEKKRHERSSGLVGAKPESTQAALEPLGVRYSLLMAGPGGIDLEVDPNTPIGSDDQARLSVQTNQDGFLTIVGVWPPSESLTRLFPSSGDGRVAGRKSVLIPLAGLFQQKDAPDQAKVIIVFSRFPATVQDALASGRSAGPLMTEQVSPGAGAEAEHAVYAVAAEGATVVSATLSLSIRP